MTERPCKLCNALVFVTYTPEGKEVALDAAAPVYYLIQSGETFAAKACYVDHAHTCPAVKKKAVAA